MGSKKHKKHKSDNNRDRESVLGADQDYQDNDEVQEKRPKLVLNLKVGAGPSQESQESAEERRHKHKKKKKKKSNDKAKERTKYTEETSSLKRRHDEDESGEDEEDDEEKEESQHHQLNGMDDESDGNSSPSRKLRSPRSCTIRDNEHDHDGAILKQMLNYLLKNLQNKDVNGFFAFPVTDSIAPGYSSIIENPMDFSTMANKMEAAEYVNVMEFKKDFILMCNNAMRYNFQDTIYYKEAKRLLHLGIKQLSKEKLLFLKKTQSFLTSITLGQLGFDESGHFEEHKIVIPEEETKDKFKPEPSAELDSIKPEVTLDEEIQPDIILAQAQEAAAKAKHALTTRKPKTDLGFLRQEDDGTTSMTILNPWNDGEVSSTQKVISLGDYMGKLKNGSGSLFKFKEDKRNKVCPETYLCYGPFSSHAPTYDSSFASCTKEESDLLLGTYGGEIGVQYAKSVEKFVENAGLSAVEMVDKLLDTLTNFQHSKSQQIQEEKKRHAEELAEKALQDEMIAKAQKAAEEAEQPAIPRDPMQRKLNETAAILSELSETQKARLSREPPPHLSMIAPPSDKEANLAIKVTDNLVTMAKQVYPRDVVSTGAVRTALGIKSLSPKAAQAANKNIPDNALEKKRFQTVVDDSDDDSDDDDDDDDDEENDDVNKNVVDNRCDSVRDISDTANESVSENMDNAGLGVEVV